MRQLTKSIAAGVGTAALVGGIGAGLAYADTPADDPTTSPSATPTTSATETPMAKPGGKRDENGFRNRFIRRHLRFVARALHGEVTLAGEKHQVIAFQRGGVARVNSTSLTVKSNDGFVETYVLSKDTKVRENGHDLKVADIDSSDRVLVVASKDDSTLDARRVIVRSK
jgi:hypothetical protein